MFIAIRQPVAHVSRTIHRCVLINSDLDGKRQCWRGNEHQIYAFDVRYVHFCEPYYILIRPRILDTVVNPNLH